MTQLIHRPRRLRRTATLRAMVRETRLDAADLIYPLFVCPGEGVRREVRSMPGVFNLSVDELVKRPKRRGELGVPGVIVFGLPEGKDEVGSAAFAEDGIVQRAVRALKREVDRILLVVADVCLCEYTDHGHCGVIRRRRGRQRRRRSRSSRGTAVSQAEAGADVVAPSGMMDGMVGAIRAGARRGGLRRDADHVLRRQVRVGLLRPVPRGGRQRAAVRRPARLPDGPGATRARRCARSALDVEEGADMVMVKPALPYLDIIRAVARALRPAARRLQRLAASTRMIKAAARARLDRRRADRARVARRDQAGPGPTSS